MFMFVLVTAVLPVNEHYYQLTCDRMKTLLDLHQKLPAAEHDRLMVRLPVVGALSTA